MHYAKGKIAYGCLFLVGLVALTTAEGPIKCLQCTPDASKDCLDPSKIESTACSAETKNCYTRSNDSGVSRGCFVESPKTCEPGSNCEICPTDDCNKHNICKTCDTSDKDCSQSNVSNAKYNGVCKTASTECFMNVKDKKVERRCAGDADSCADNATCKKCSGVNCNAGIFPADRRQCFQCSGENCDTFGSTADNAKPCLNFVADDKCYSMATSANDMKRGCTSDVDPKPCDASDKACSTCAADKCNKFTYKRNAALSCIKCSTTDADCPDAHAADKAEACKEQLLYNQTEVCYTLTKGSSVQRGCLYDDTSVECDATKDECKLCQDKNGCNNEKVDIKFTCIVCRSDVNKKCWNDADKLTGSNCRTGDSSEKEGCFHGIWNGIAIRGCLIDADERMKVVCGDKQNKQCTVCNKKDCNKGSSSGAGTLTLPFSLLAMMLSVFWYSK